MASRCCAFQQHVITNTPFTTTTSSSLFLIPRRHRLLNDVVSQSSRNIGWNIHRRYDDHHVWRLSESMASSGGGDEKQQIVEDSPFSTLTTETTTTTTTTFDDINDMNVDNTINTNTTTTSTNDTSNMKAINGDTINNTPKIPSPLTIWRFTRPHTLIGSALAIPSLHILAATPTFSAAFTSTRALYALLYSLLPSLLMNLYITGLNQITDIDIDKINKPNLPLPSGELSMRNAVIVVLLALVGSLALVFAKNPFVTPGLQMAVIVSMILGTCYSLPPIRLKRQAVLAASCIVAVRGAVINAGFFAHSRMAAYSNAVFSRNSVWGCLVHEPKCTYSTLFFAVFGMVIALMKDVPDAKGDAIFKIRTFTVRLGQRKVLNMMTGVLMMLFGVYGLGFMAWSFMMDGVAGVGVGVGVGMFWKVCRVMIGLVGMGGAWHVNRMVKDVDVEDSADIYRYYMELWKYFYLSYLVLPFAR